MENQRPMDRLICGDVGYGKTEVALRAAFKAVMDNKQVAILVPTTVLAQQHYHTFQNRLAAYPMQVEMLSRFRTPQQQHEILERLEAGSVDIIIGTHRLLQGDILFKDLGLLIIDEEQRFGVAHKETLKKMRTEVDVLTMTATPIPRTLYMTLTGVRDISTINTPPEERLPVITHVGPYSPRLVRQAILRELERGGQVFFVHNRVQTIGAMRIHMEKLVPEARLAVAHGQMPEHALSEKMEQFTAGEIDVLLSTSIIESGLDIPNANTLIVDRADTFGLAQLYQLRGRVGRGAQRAYAYFFRHGKRPPTEEGRQRLETIAENTQLGAGFSIAMRDLEIRGAGDLLGMRQHGHIAAVGFHLYTRLLADAVRRQRSQSSLGGSLPPMAGPSGFPGQPQGLDESAISMPVSVDLPLPVSIPAGYVPDRETRLRLYRRLADLRRLDEVGALSEEFIDRFGPLPEAVQNLFFQLKVKILAEKAGLASVSSENGQIVMRYPAIQDGAPGRSYPDLGTDVRTGKNAVWLTNAAQEGWRERLLGVMTILS
jgi:transcription-repair coupling factor (superfamily II helicase)